ncbi:hypothetical protein [Microbulbifer sediminum]|uniref:hypothetical protein n=1 Tax=Microbulbifer sediminum TaxID=2904250 RepID=UPI001F17C0E0|nr:hypothetical protein [Microbulbifer sediminum]
MISTTRLLTLAGLLSVLSVPVWGQGNFLGFKEDTPNPRVKIAPAEIALDIPMPVSGAGLAELLAQANAGLSLTAIKDEALRTYHTHVHNELSQQLTERFNDSEIPLVENAAHLTLQNSLDVQVIKRFSDLRNGSEYKLERGKVELEGVYRYQWLTPDGRTVRQGEIDISGLRISESYKTKTPHGEGTGEDTTEESIKRALTEMVDEMLDESEEDFEAEQLRTLALR